MIKKSEADGRKGMGGSIWTITVNINLVLGMCIAY